MVLKKLLSFSKIIGCLGKINFVVSKIIVFIKILVSFGVLKTPLMALFFSKSNIHHEKLQRNMIVNKYRYIHTNIEQ